MAKNLKADGKNANKGTPGTNKTYDQIQGEKGKHKNPNWKPKPKSKE